MKLFPAHKARIFSRFIHFLFISHFFSLPAEIKSATHSFHMSISHLLFGRLTTLILLFCILSPLSATQNDPRALDPADVFFQAWLVIRDAEKLKKEGKINEARLKYKQAATYYNIITRFHKNYRPAMVANRVRTTAESIRELEAKALKEIAKRNARTRDFVEGGSLDSAKKSGLGHQIRLFRVKTLIK